MSLNIKNERTHALVRELATLTGLTQTSAVEDAVRRRLEELRTAGQQDRHAPAPDYTPAEVQRRVAAMERIATEFRSVTTPKQRAAMADHGTWMYDEHGLPR